MNVQKKLPKFCIVQNFKTAVPSEWNDVKELMQSAQVKNLCSQIAALDPTAADYAKQKSALKQKLPCITVHSCKFDGNTRDKDAAYWNGLVCLEYDHLTSEEIEAFRQVEPPTSGIILAGKSCSGGGVWMLIEVPESDYQQMELTMQMVHEDYCRKIQQRFGIDISEKLDKATDLARLRFLPPYEYIWWDMVEDFHSEEEQEAGYMSMYGEVIAKCQEIPSTVPEGTRNNTYFKEMVKLARQYTTNTHILLKYLPSLGLDEKERIGCLNFAKNITTEKPKADALPTLNTKAQPIDMEALPFPYKAAPRLVQTLVRNLPTQWRQSAALCLLPALSAACGQISKADGTPLVFQVALYGLPQSGKTKFSARPATLVQDYIGRNDNDYRKAIEYADKGLFSNPEMTKCPKILAFTDTSIVQMMKYLQYAKDQTVMAYEGDLSSAIAGKECSFLDIKKILRKGFDGETAVMDYKNESSFKGAIKARLSALVVGTPSTIFNYFNAQSTTEGNSRRVILVEHEMIMKNITSTPYTEEELTFIYSELDQLQCLPPQVVKNETIEKAAFAWRAKKQTAADGDPILWAATQTPTEMFQRAAYLMWVINRFDEKTLKDCCTIGKWVAEYQFRSYINNTYNEQKAEHKKYEARKAPSTQKTQENFNKQMYEELPTVFTRNDVIQYRIDHDYPHDVYSQAIITRWKNQGLVAPSKDKTWVKM